MSFRQFNHLNVPEHWERYWTKYPQGMTILESLFEWVSQVDSMVDNVNKWNTYLDDFVKKFDAELQGTVSELLNIWLADGTLAQIINVEVLGGKADQDGLFVSAKRYGVVADGVTDDTAAMQRAIDSNNPIALPMGNIKITNSLFLKENTRMRGLGIYLTVFKPTGNFTLFDGSDEIALQNVTIEDIGVVGEGAIDSVAFDLYYWTNNSQLNDVRVEHMDTALKVSKSWYAQFNRLRLRENGRANIELISPSTSEQVNSLGFNDSSIMMAENNIIIHGAAPSQTISFNNCTIEASRKTAVYSRGASPLIFDNCYFERNYTDAQKGKGSVVLTINDGIDLDVDTYNTRSIVQFNGGYMSRSGDFNESTQKVGILLRTYPQLVMVGTVLQCGKSAYLDYDVYSNSDKLPFIRGISRDGYAKKLYEGIMNKHINSTKTDINFRYTVNTRMIFSPVEPGDYYIDVIGLQDLAFPPNTFLKVTDVVTGLVVNEHLLTNAVKGKPIRIRIGRLTGKSAISLEVNNTTEADMNAIYVVYSEDTY